jgi:hypothetical protein
MKNLEQIRAAHAVRFWKSEPARKITAPDDLECVQNLPALILRLGLLATLAFAKTQGHIGRILMDDLASHLSPGRGGILPVPAPNLDGLIHVLTHELSDTVLLQRATAETLAYLRFLVRFGPQLPGSPPA